MTATGHTASIPGLEPTLPSEWYRSADIFQIEKERIFCREWICAAREEQLPHAGDHRVLNIVGESVLLVRNREGALRAFYNVCRHRGARLCREDATAPIGLAVQGGVVGGRSIICPYHQWAYDLDGRLSAAPHLTGAVGFDKSGVQLYPVALQCWGGFVFLNLTPRDAAPLEQQLGEIPGRIQRYPLAALRIGHTIRYSVAANWKAICEN
ncbi:MAG: aromatic ring-hydroxylating dioxygenase subunit alpha, partial [Sinobacteraceae bacterium]|nr:aromatic ring-hydroxylating dioxygenase subunit alpha [Nevskiaceae bacterium]